MTPGPPACCLADMNFPPPPGGAQNPYAASSPAAEVQYYVQSNAPFSVPLPLATRASRLGASILDGLIFVLAILPTILMMSLGGPGSNDMGIIGFAITAMLVVGLFVFQTYLTAKTGQSLGKRWLGIRIVKMDGSNPGFVHGVLLRSWILIAANAVPAAGNAFSLVDVLFIFRSDQRCVHDLIAGTQVVDARSSYYLQSSSSP